jgi:carbon monoxide dehydrogenase subunit G
MELLKSLGLIGSVLLAVAAAIVTISGGGDGLWEHDGVVKISAPRDEVFHWLTNPEKRQEWVVGLVDSKADPPGWLKEGSRLIETVEVDGERRKRILEITEHEVDSIFAYRTSEDGVDVVMRYAVGVHLSGARTRIDYTCQAQFPGWLAKVIEPILGHRRLSRMKQGFERLSTQLAKGD